MYLARRPAEVESEAPSSELGNRLQPISGSYATYRLRYNKKMLETYIEKRSSIEEDAQYITASQAPSPAGYDMFVVGAGVFSFVSSRRKEMMRQKEQTKIGRVFCLKPGQPSFLPTLCVKWNTVQS